MSRQRPDFLGQGILLTVTQKVQRFRLGHALLLVTLAVALTVAVACLDWQVPRWPVYALTMLLVLDALLHAAINRGYAEGEVRAWQQVLGLADTVMHQARVDDAIKSTPSKPARKSLYGPRPPLRVVRPDEEPPEQSK
jgi:hypothetical protein